MVWASLARYLGEALNVSERDCDTLELADLLDDIGKLRMPDELLENLAPTAVENRTMITSTAPATRANGISLEARSIAAADVFQALAQRQPYREALPPQGILDILQKQVENGKLDPLIVTCVAKNLQACRHAVMQVMPNCEPVLYRQTYFKFTSSNQRLMTHTMGSRKRRSQALTSFRKLSYSSALTAQ